MTFFSILSLYIAILNCSHNSEGKKSELGDIKSELQFKIRNVGIVRCKNYCNYLFFFFFFFLFHKTALSHISEFWLYIAIQTLFSQFWGKQSELRDIYFKLQDIRSKIRIVRSFFSFFIPWQKQDTTLWDVKRTILRKEYIYLQDVNS